MDWFYLNGFLADRTYVIHRSCFDLWDFILGIWKLVTGLFAGFVRVILVYLIATANVLRIDWTIFGGRIGWLDVGYNAFASTASRPGGEAGGPRRSATAIGSRGDGLRRSCSRIGTTTPRSARRRGWCSRRRRTRTRGA